MQIIIYIFDFSPGQYSHVPPGRVEVGCVAAGVLDAGVSFRAQKVHHLGSPAIPGHHPHAPLKLRLVQCLQSRARDLWGVGAGFIWLIATLGHEYSEMSFIILIIEVIL